MNESGFESDIYPSDENLASVSSTMADPSDFLVILSIVLADPNLFLALRDLADALKTFHIAPINCARAIEALRNYFIPLGGSREDGWGTNAVGP